MALLKRPYSAVGTEVKILLRNRRVQATVTGLPFLPPFNKR